MKKLIMDLDDTIWRAFHGDYENSEPNYDVIEKMKQLL